MKLDGLIQQFQEKYHGLGVLDLSRVGTVEFENHLNDLSIMESQLDDLIKEELDALAKAQNNFAQMLSAQTPELKSKVEEIKLLYANYELSRQEYGGAKDYKRYAAFTDLFFKTKELYEEVRSGPPKLKLAKIFEQFEKIAKRVKNFMQMSVKLAIPSLQMLLSAFQNITNTKIGFGKSVDLFFKKWGEISDITVEVNNKEYLKDQKKLRIYVPTHRDANLDAIAFAALDVDNPAVFGALNLKNHPIFGVKDNPLIKPLITSLEKNDSFILAGAPEKPIEKFIRLIKENKIKNALIYPEGQVGLGIKESRPVRENFSHSLLKRLVTEDIAFELVPVTYMNGAQYFEYHNELGKMKVEDGQHKLSVNVHKPISSESVEYFLRKYDSRHLNTYLRFLWLFEMETGKDLIFGQGRWNNIQDAFQAKMNGTNSCSKSLRALTQN